jgi:hypothetical protein
MGMTGEQLPCEGEVDGMIFCPPDLTQPPGHGSGGRILVLFDAWRFP